MKSLALAAFLTGILVFWILYSSEPTRFRGEAEAGALAGNFILYRTAVHRYAFAHRVPGVIPDAALRLPDGLLARGWRNHIVADESGKLRCYVYGPATPETATAAYRQLRGSAAIGWKNHGMLLRPASEQLALPDFIPERSIVSVIYL